MEPMTLKDGEPMNGAAVPWQPLGEVLPATVRTIRVGRMESQRRDDGNGQLAVLPREALLAEIEKLRRQRKVHREQITRMNQVHNEDLRNLQTLREENWRLRQEADRFSSALEMFRVGLMGEDA